MKTIFIVPGFRHQASEEQYAWMKNYFEGKGFLIRFVPIHWNNRTMSDYVKAFKDYYLKHKTDENYILGFSFGAMIACISASDLKPEKLILCSLSPYFKEYLGTLHGSWIKAIGKRRFEDFKNFSIKNISKKITSPTTIFYGEKEAQVFPILKKCCMSASSLIEKSQLIIVKDSPHKIDHPSYVDAIKKTV